MKYRLVIEIDVNEGICGTDAEEKSFFENEILKYKNDNCALYLHSNYIGDELGQVKVIELLPTA